MRILRVLAQLLRQLIDSGCELTHLLHELRVFGIAGGDLGLRFGDLRIALAKSALEGCNTRRGLRPPITSFSAIPRHTHL
ncbi:MAG: hypothetical protein GY944_20555 [bacterium]|nr:hypothetical protein [bacterium]